MRHFTNLVLVFTMLLMSPTVFAQNDVTQFLSIPVDGFKSEMIKKLKDKGFTNSDVNKDVLVGEFNGTDVNLHVRTNNNKVWRIMVADRNSISEADIKIRFNKLCQLFQNNKNYVSLPDSTVSKYIIPDDEDISYELVVNKKRYQALFYQRSRDYDSLTLEMKNLLLKDQLNETEKVHLSEIMVKMIDSNIFKKVVWFTINVFEGKYYISIYYDNENNKANGENL